MKLGVSEASGLFFPVFCFPDGQLRVQKAWLPCKNLSKFSERSPASPHLLKGLVGGPLRSLGGLSGTQ